eukprot:scaffold25039_cov69-Phaeocystis_antarctica.AAC.9
MGSRTPPRCASACAALVSRLLRAWLSKENISVTSSLEASGLGGPVSTTSSTTTSSSAALLRRSASTSTSISRRAACRACEGMSSPRGTEHTPQIGSCTPGRKLKSRAESRTRMPITGVSRKLAIVSRAMVEGLEKVGAGPLHTGGAAGEGSGGPCLPQPLRRGAVAVLELHVRRGDLNGHSGDHAWLHVAHADQADLDRPQRTEAPLRLLTALRAAAAHLRLLRLLLGAQLEGHEQPTHRGGPCAGARVLRVHLENLRRIWAEEIEPLRLGRLLRAGAEVVVVVRYVEVLDRTPRPRGCKAEADDLRCRLVAEQAPQQTRVTIIHDERDLGAGGRSYLL